MRFQRPAALLATVTLVTGLAVAATVAPASADPHGPHHAFREADHAVFVQNDDVTGNAVIAYDRSPSGELQEAASYATGGLGGALTGSVVDHLASEGSLSYDRGLLVAVNAGSDTITTFAVYGDRLVRLQVLPSGGSFPVSVALHGDQVFVLDARDGGAIQGYLRVGDRLVEVPAWHRGLGLDPAQTPEFTSTPGQIGFTPDGRRLVVTTKNGSNAVLVYDLSRFGLGAPVVTQLPGAVPFGFAFDSRGALVLTEAGTNSVATFWIARSGELVPLASAATGQAATCWAVVAGRQVYASNAGSGTLSGYRLGDEGDLQSLGTTATDAGTVDAATSPHGHFLYVQTGATGTVDGFRVGHDGELTPTGSVIVPNAAGGEGIVVR